MWGPKWVINLQVSLLLFNFYLQQLQFGFDLKLKMKYVDDELGPSWDTIQVMFDGYLDGGECPNGCLES